LVSHYIFYPTAYNPMKEISIEGIYFKK